MVGMVVGSVVGVGRVIGMGKARQGGGVFQANVEKFSRCANGKTFEEVSIEIFGKSVS